MEVEDGSELVFVRFGLEERVSLLEPFGLADAVTFIRPELGQHELFVRVLLREAHEWGELIFDRGPWIGRISSTIVPVVRI